LLPFRSFLHDNHEDTPCIKKNGINDIPTPGLWNLLTSHKMRVYQK